jgi:hypothetical protein
MEPPMHRGHLYSRLQPVMRSFVLLLLAFSSVAQVQESHIGLRLTGWSSLNASFVLPLAGLQGGALLTDDLELRGTLDTDGLVNYLQGDLLYSGRLSQGLKGYAGVGPDVVLFAFVSDTDLGRPSFGVHGTLGTEYKMEEIALFTEVQSGFLFNTLRQMIDTLQNPFLKLTTGIKLYF